MATQRNWRLGLGAALACCALGAAADGGVYIGASAAAALYDVKYSKGVDSRNPANVAGNAGRVLFATDSASRGTWDAGLLLGYRFAFAVAHLDIEASAVTHRGTAKSHLAGAGASPGRDQLGEVWPEDWTLAKDRSYGLTVRVGASAPTVLGVSVYALAGARRLDAEFKTSYTGCLLAGGCDANSLAPGRERHDESYNAWVLGVGVEKRLGVAALRAELTYTDHGSSERTVRFDDVAVRVPVDLASREVGAGVSLIWRL